MKVALEDSEIKTQVTKFLQSTDGVKILLTGALVLSDFDDLDVALKEAQKTLLGNKSYFQAVVKKACDKSTP